MTLHRFLNLCLIGFVLVAYIALLAFGYEADKEDKAAISSRDFAARQVCGQEAAFEWRGDELQCFTHRGHRASRQVIAEVQQ